MSSSSTTSSSSSETCKKCDKPHEDNCEKKLTLNVSAANEEILDAIVTVRFDIAAATKTISDSLTSAKKFPGTDQRALALANTKLEEFDMWFARAMDKVGV